MWTFPRWYHGYFYLLPMGVVVCFLYPSLPHPSDFSAVKACKSLALSWGLEQTVSPRSWLSISTPGTRSGCLCARYFQDIILKIISFEIMSKTNGHPLKDKFCFFHSDHQPCHLWSVLLPLGWVTSLSWGTSKGTLPVSFIKCGSAPFLWFLCPEILPSHITDG
jgi:hypothetical protein